MSVSTVVEVVDRIREKQTKQAKCMAELILWGEVKNQGIDPNQVRAFGYSEKLLTPAQKKVFYMFATKWLPDPITGKRERELGLIYICTLVSTMLIVDQAICACVAYALGGWVGTYIAVTRER